MKNYFTIAVFLFSFHCDAQQIKNEAKKNNQKILLNVCLPYYINERDVSLVEGNKRYMSAKNTLGYKFEIAYEYVNKKGISFTPSLGYGIQKTDLEWHFKSKDFAPFLLPEIYTYKFAPTAHYLSTSFLVGYGYNLFRNKKTVLQTKAGIGIASFFAGYDDKTYITLDYTDNLGVEQSKTMGYIDAEAGSDLFENKLVSFNNRFNIDINPYYQLYLGIANPINLGIVKEYKLGVSFTHAIKLNKQDWGFDITKSTYYQNSGSQDGIEIYDNKFRSIGIVAGIGF